MNYKNNFFSKEIFENYDKIKEEKAEQRRTFESAEYKAKVKAALLFDRLKNCGADCQTEDAIERLQTMTFDNFRTDTPERQAVYDKVKNCTSQFVLLHGNYGTGKTHLAFAYARQEIEKSFRMTECGNHLDWFAYFTGAGLSAKYKKASLDFNSDYKTFVSKIIAKYALIIIDEIGQGCTSTCDDSEHKAIYSIVDSCELNGRKLILISNLDRKNFLNFLTQRTVDRISESCTGIEFTGESMRKLKH